MGTHLPGHRNSTRSPAYTSAMFSETRYALNGDLRVAYRTSREGPRDIVFVSNWITNCEVFPELPSVRGWVEAMTTLGRVIFFDQPGTGASDPVTADEMPNMEQWADSITAVLDDLGCREAVILAIDRAFAPAALFAATHPARTTALVALECYADPLAETIGGANLEDGTAAALAMWGTGETLHATNPDMPWNEEIRASWARLERLTSSPRTVALMGPLFAKQDVRAVLPTIRVPTLVLHHTDDEYIPPTQGRFIADRIPGAKYVELPGRNMYHIVEPWRASFQEVAEFLTGQHADVADERAQLSRFRGREVNTSGDGFLATFDGPQRAIRCAMAIRDAVAALGVEVRAGLHTGECEIRGDDIGGIAVHIGARGSALAVANEVLVSSTLHDLVIGSGLEFEDRGAHELKGVPGEWHLLAVASP